MTTRDQIVRTALGFNGTCNGKGYDGPNPFSADLSRPAEAWCGDYVTDIYKRAQIPLPSMQPGCRTGFAYCPNAVEYGRKHGATRWSWQAGPGDIVLFDWNGDGVADHTEIVTGYQGGVLFTIGGNSGPSNVNASAARAASTAIAGTRPPDRQRPGPDRDRHLQGGHLRRTRPPRLRRARHRRPSLGCSCSSRR